VDRAIEWAFEKYFNPKVGIDPRRIPSHYRALSTALPADCGN